MDFDVTLILIETELIVLHHYLKKVEKEYSSCDKYIASMYVLPDFERWVCNLFSVGFFFFLISLVFFLMTASIS